MKVSELIAMADELVPNPFSDTVKLHLINEIERRIQLEVRKVDEEDLALVTAATLSTADLFESDRDAMYLAWMKAMYYWNMGEYDTYENERAMYNALWEEYLRDVCDRDHQGSCGREYVYGSSET